MTNHNGFLLIKEYEIPELKTTARYYRHEKTGAELLSLQNEDENKVFGITFRTPPEDSTGIAHIMEHSVLCGSRKYPVKEPFVELMKGSLNTFLNAMTFSDKTSYPVASTNLQDFYNLVDVYLDAVFYPLISPYTLQQEGWHYELENPGDPIIYKGVVFNEMKGVYSTPENLLDEKSQHFLFPDSPYRFDSGGDPEVIPDLTYAQFKQFHEIYYHPSNARIFFYGDDDPDERLRILNEYLNNFEYQPVPGEIPLQPRFEKPGRFVLPYDTGGEEAGKKALLTLNWLLPEAGDFDQAMALMALTHILIGTPAASLRKALIESGLGEDLVGRGLETASRQMFFSIGMKGVQLENVDKVESLIIDTLARLSKDGIDKATLEASLNTIEFRLRENNTGSAPRGLLLMIRSLTNWLYGGDPVEPLAYERPLQGLKKRLESDESYFESLLRLHFLENNHRTTVILQPDPELGSRREAAERKRLDKARSSLTEKELQELAENTRELQRRQEAPDSPEALATIPLLTLADIDREIKRIPCEVLEQADCTLLYHDIFTNGILYLDAGFDMSSLPEEMLPYVPLFSRALIEMGTDLEDYVKLSQRIGRSTGGIVPSWFTSAVPDTVQGAAWMFLRGKAVVGQVGELLAIFQDILQRVRWDNRERFKQMVLEARASMETNLLQGGHAIVNRRLRAHFSTADWAAEQMSGVTQLMFLRELAEKVDRDWPSVLQVLQEIQNLLLHRPNILLNITLDKDNWHKIRPEIDAFIESLPLTQAERKIWTVNSISPVEGLSAPSQVNYVGKGVNLYELGYDLHGSIFVIVPYMRNTWLWDKVRVQGGAYGGLSVFDRQSGVLTFLSYRDPNLLETLDVYDQAGNFLSQLKLSDRELTKGIIGAIGDLDAYQLPDAQGFSSMVRYLSRITDEERQVLRDQVLSTTQSDFRALGEALAQLKETGVIAIIGSEAALETAKVSERIPLEVKKVL
jgi:presequence protease